MNHGFPPPHGQAPVAGPSLAGLFRATDCDDWLPARPPLHRRDCTVHFLKSARFRLPGAVLKVFRPGAVPDGFVTAFHRRSLRCHANATAECAVPEPLLAQPEHGMLAMEWVTAPTASSRILRAVVSPRTRRECLARAARWLKWFHGQDQVAFRPFDSSTMAGWIHRMRRRLPADFPGADRLLGDCLTLAEQLAGEIHGCPVPYGMAHGDFTPANLFIRNDRTIGIDYWSAGRLPIHHEISRFLVYAELYQAVPTRRGELASHGCRRELLDAFVETLDVCQPWDDRLWLRLHFMEVTRRLVSLRIPHARLAQRWWRACQTALLRRAARCMLRRLRRD